jgi:type IV secretory pathway VirB2 component (pilin)
MPIKSALLLSSGMALMILLVGADSAFAASMPVADVGANLKSLIGGLAKNLVIPVAALMGISALLRRDIGHAMTIAVITIVIGIFAYDPNASHAITSIANEITKGL